MPLNAVFTLPYLVVPMLSVTLTLLREFLGPVLGGVLVYYVGYQWMTTVSMQYMYILYTFTNMLLLCKCLHPFLPLSSYTGNFHSILYTPNGAE